VLVYYRSDVLRVLRLRTDPEGRKIALLVGIGTIPALIGLPLAGTLERFQDTVSNVGWALVFTGVVLIVGQRVATGARTLIEGRVPDAIVVGLFQAAALIPGISRSGMTISAAAGRQFGPTEAARFSFLLGIPAIAGGGLSQLLNLSESGGFGLELLLGLAVAAISGYFAIAFLISVLQRVGLVPFAIYCLLVGLATILVF
jgi:undecaprenyl-diphosphatase